MLGILDFGAGASPNTGKRKKNSLGQGTHIVSSICAEELGQRPVPMHLDYSRPDVLLVGLYWWEHLYDLAKWLADHGINPLRSKRSASDPKIIAGGQLVSMNPAPASAIVDACCIGDGEGVVAGLVDSALSGSPPPSWSAPGVYVSETPAPTEWQHCDDISSTIRWPFYNSVTSVGTAGVRRTETFERRIEVARGCRKRCRFCGIAWTKKYRELPAGDVAAAIMAEPARQNIKCFAPEPWLHSQWGDICAAFDSLGKKNQARDMSARTALAVGFGNGGHYSVGIEGLSERLRRSLSKPLSNDSLVDLVEMASGNSGQINLYLMCDLPGETRDDYAEFASALARVNLRTRPPSKRYHGPPGGFFITTTLNMFCPTPHTPMELESIRPDNTGLGGVFYDEIDRALGPRDGRKLRVKILGRPHGPRSRVLEAAALRGNEALGRYVCAMAPHRKRTWSADDCRVVARRMGLDGYLESAINGWSEGDKPWRMISV